MKNDRTSASSTAGRELSEAVEEFRSIADQIELFIFVYRFLKERPQSSYAEISEEVRSHYGLVIPHHRMAAAIDQLEKQLGLRLVLRSQRSKANTLGIDAERLYKRAFRLIEEMRRLKGAEEVVRIGAPDLLTNFVIPSIAAEYRRHPNAPQGVAFEVSECREAEEIVNMVGNGAVDFALTWAYDDKLDRLKRLSDPRGLKVELLFEVDGVGFDNPAPLEFDLLMICSPTHRFVREAKLAASEGRTWKLSLTELKDEEVVILPPRRQPLLKNIHIPMGSRGRLIEVDSFTQVLAHVRGLIKDAVGLVPSIYTELNELRRKGLIFCSKIEPPRAPHSLDPDKKDPTKVLIACVSQGGIVQLHPPVQRFLRCAEPVLRRIAQLEDFDPSVLDVVPETIEEFRRYKHCYFVMHHERIFGIPGWFKGTLNWEPANDEDKTKPRGSGERKAIKHIEGRIRGHLGGMLVTKTSRDWTFEVHGWLRQNEDSRAKRDRSFQFVGEGRPPEHNNTIVCTFNIRVIYEDYDVLIGVWSGRDDYGLATVAPMVLSARPFGSDLAKLRTILNKSSYRFLPNAEDWGVTSEDL